MLVLSRKINQRIYIGDDITITVCEVDRGKVRIGIEAPRGMPIFREELLTAEQRNACEHHHDLGGEG